MQLLSLEVWNILGCRHGFLDLSDRSLSIIGGRNYQGKSSFLTGLQMVLGGKRKDIFPLCPITDGEDEAKIVAKLVPEEGDEGIPWPCCVVRTLVRKEENGGAYDTKVEIIEGHDPLDDEAIRAATPQKLLDELAADGLAFDPLKFVSSSATAQADTLRALVGINFTKIDQERDKLYQRRTGVNKEVSIVEGQIKGLELPNDVPSERVDVRELTAQLKADHDYNEAIRRTHADKLGAERNIDEKTILVANLQEQLKAAKDQLAAMQDHHDKLAADLENSLPKDTTDIEQQIQQAASVNELIDRQEQALRLRQQRRERKQASDTLTKAIKALDKKKRDMATDADWPVEGLGFGPTGVTLNDTPFSSLSSAEQLRCAVAIQLRKNPQFPVAVIRDGSLLDNDSLCDLTKTVVELGGKCFVERVGPEECHLLFEHGYGLDPDDIEHSPVARPDTND